MRCVSTRLPSLFNPARLLVTMSAASHTLVLDSFCLKQFDDPEYTGTRVAYDKVEFEAKVNALHTEGAPLVDGYAPFCKHVFVPNFTPAVTPCTPLPSWSGVGQTSARASRRLTRSAR